VLHQSGETIFRKRVDLKYNYLAFNVYRSSAGSGKTFTLVREYLVIVLKEPAEFRHILAITFTNKAAAEMKERVLHALNQLSMHPAIPDPKIGENLLPQLVKDTLLTEPEIALRAGRVLRMILHGYSDFAIGTIDSFSHRVIRSFAHDFGLPVQFNVEMDAEMLLTSAVDLLLDKVGEDEALTRFLVRFLEARMDEDKGWQIDRILVDFAHALLDEEGQDHILQLRSLTLEDFTRIAGVLHGRVAGFEKTLSEKGQEALNSIAAAGLAITDFFQGNKGIGKYFEYLATGRTDKIQPNTLVLATVSEDRWTAGKVSPGTRSAIEGIKPELQRRFEEVTGLIAQHEENYILYKLLLKTIYPLAVLNEIDRVLGEFKKQNNLVHISEFNRRISSVVMREPVPFIYERLGERYHHLMIDEFQDTSRLQWQNFVPLLENALSEGHFNLVVGDGKQAIYRWRNGDVMQFARLPVLQGSSSNPVIRQRQEVLTSHFVEESLNMNYRSKLNIVDFNNRFFRYLSDFLDEQGQEVYRGLEQECDPAKRGGYIRIRFIPSDDESTGYEEMTFGEILGTVRSLEQDGFSPRYIAILCRKNAEASRIARTLLLEGMDVVSSESLLVAQSPEVNFVVAFIGFLLEPENPLIRASMAGYLLQTGRLKDLIWPELVGQINSPADPSGVMARLLREMGWPIQVDQMLSLPVYDLCETVIRIFRLNKGADPFLRFFLDAVLTFTTKDLHSLSDFPEWWEDQKAKLSVVVPEGLNAVRIMTIHKAKGLQFPVVIFPFATETRRLTKDYLWADLRGQEIPGLPTALLKTEAAMEKTAFAEQYREEDRNSMLDLVNLLYVVMTRPEERLYIFTASPPAKMDNLRSLPAFFAGFLQSEGKWTDEQSDYRFGSPDPCLRNPEATEAEPLMLNTMISEDWRNRIRIRSRAPQMWDMENPLGKSHFGNKVHGLLSQIKVASDAGRVLTGAITAGLIPNDEQERVEKMLHGVLEHPQLAHLYSDAVTVKTEPEILLPDGNVMRPDRVVLDKGSPVIIEYKTGRKDERHAGQLDRYAGAMAEMGYPVIRRVLVYLHDEIEVSSW
jgi:ATP-dependent exoDNAse (exonuclease V) beta subunit